MITSFMAPSLGFEILEVIKLQRLLIIGLDKIHTKMERGVLFLFFLFLLL